MKKTKNHGEVKPPLPIDKPATYENETKRVRSNQTTGNRESDHQSDKTSSKNPQKERERLEHDTSKRERDPGMTKK